jgi:hypothetical protein
MECVSEMSEVFKQLTWLSGREGFMIFLNDEWRTALPKRRVY